MTRMTLEDVLGWVKTLCTKAEHYYCGTLPNKREHSFGIYQLKESRKRDLAIGGEENTKTLTKGVTILVHWDRSTRATENAAQALYEELSSIGRAEIGSFEACYIALAENEPVDVGADEDGVMERVIDFVIYYNRKD